MEPMSTMRARGGRQFARGRGVSQSAVRVSNDMVHVGCDASRRGVLNWSSDRRSPMTSNRSLRRPTSALLTIARTDPRR